MKTVRQRFYAKFAPDPATGCWLWLAGKLKKGYGQFSVGKKKITAHRMSWELHNGAIPNALLVLHKCDVPACVNPGHLFLGTYSDNIQDCIKKGRLNPPPKKTHCIKGHAFTPENTFPRWNGTQACKRCRSNTQLAYKSRNLEAVQKYQREHAREKREACHGR